MSFLCSRLAPDSGFFSQSTPSPTQGVKAHEATGSELDSKMLPAMLKEQEALLGKTSIRRYTVLATFFRPSSIPARRSTLGHTTAEARGSLLTQASMSKGMLAPVENKVLTAKKI